MKKRIFCHLLMGLFFCAGVFGQSNAFLDTFLDKKEATYGESVFLALASAGLVAPDGTVADALAYLKTAGWGYVKNPDEPVTLGDLCHVLMRAYKMNGGVMYAVFPGPRYAVREFEFRELVRHRPIPSRRLTGEEVLRIIGAVMSQREGAAP